MQFKTLLTVFLVCPLWLAAQYKQPSADVVKMVEAPPTPGVSISPAKDAMMLTDYNPYPGIATLARPFLKLAGLRVDPVLNSRQRITEYTAVTIQWLDTDKKVRIQLPAYGRLAGVPKWSPDGRRIAFGVDTDQGVELWVSDTRTGRSFRAGNFYCNEVLGTYNWMDDSERLFIFETVKGRGPAPAAAAVPSGPNIEETEGKVAQVMTFQDLLKSESDEQQFEFYATSQLALFNVKTRVHQLVGKADLHMSANWSPDENYLLVTTLKRPFSYRVQYNNFARKTDIWSKTGTSLRTIVEYPVTDEIPRQGVVSGPRSFEWQALYPARLTWAEALDGGDPKKKADFRDKVMLLDAPFKEEPRELLKTKYRYNGFEWTANQDIAVMSEYDRDRRWLDSWLMDLKNPAKKDSLFSLSINDDYNNPGDPIYQRLPNGEYVIAQEGDWAWFRSDGASPKGEFPRLDKINLRTRERQTVYQSPETAYDNFIAFAGKQYDRIITRYESKTEVPNFFLVDLKTKSRKALTQFKDPAPQMTGVEKRLVTYKRPDGVPLSGTLYLPPNYQKGQKLPLFMWAYPLEYSDAATAGQVRGSDTRFTFYRGDSPLFFVTQGYAVLMDATIPIVGDPETMNNTFIEQATASGKAAIDYLDSLGIIDRKRVGVGGHSYGAFMTANLLAHSSDYAYGIARSGAYNRTLTPFGFQSERRSFWEAKDIYMNVSPFTHADKIKKPLLMIHGEADNNPGTFTVQSERLYQAIKGNGGTARLVLLPHESHGYRAKESIEHVLAEMFNWAGKYSKEVKP